MQKLKIPNHVAIIMDGNGRWAKAHHLTRSQGHLEGVKRVQEIIKEASDSGVKFLTLFAFSTENWNRPENEVSLLMRTLVSVLEQKSKELHKKEVKINFIGQRKGVPNLVLKTFDIASNLTDNNKGMVLNIAFNYGSRAEIIEAVKNIYQKISEKKFDINNLDEQSFSKFLFTKNQPDVDLLIRTSGEQRISNFLLWQISYAEFYFTTKYWPEFTVEEFHKALKDFASRDRRYGTIKASN